MRSIRLSLIVYFLALAGLALGAVSWLVYHTTAQTLKDKQISTAQLVEAQYHNQCDEARAALDLRILRQAQRLARKATSSSIFFETLYPLGALSSPLAPQAFLSIPLWTAQGTQREFALPLHRLRPPDIIIEGFEDLLPNPEPGEPVEYFQTFHSHGQPIQRSDSLENHYLTLDPEAYQESELYQERFDTVQMNSETKLRRVTLRVPWPRFRLSTNFPWPTDMFRPGKGGGFIPRPPPPSSIRPPALVEKAPSIFIQYASDTGPLQQRLAGFLAYRDARLAQLDEETGETLHSLRLRLLWIGLATFASLMVGGFILVWLGLKPLARLSDAVSQVSPKDFQLNLNVQELPRELKPIAGRLSETLQQLQKAFTREKQAAADISHELRTPVAALLATLDVGLRKQRSAAEYRELLEECKSTGDHMAVLVERLLALARLDAGADQLRLQHSDLADLARQCADLVRPLAAAKGLQLKVHAPLPLYMEADPDKFREILTNLLHNAIEYNKPQGSIELTARQRAGQVVFEVRDTGIGIPTEAREQIFKRFFRADPSRHADTPHAGLGLSIVKSYVDLMGGTIDVDSSPAGSTFRVALPAAPAPRAA